VRLKSINFIGDIKHSREIKMRKKIKLTQVQPKSIGSCSLTTSQRSNKKRRRIKKAIKWIVHKKKIHFI